MSAALKPRLKLTIIAGRPVTVPVAIRETPLEAARRRFGDKPFGHEPGSKFKWTSGPTVLEAWLHKRRTERST